MSIFWNFLRDFGVRGAPWSGQPLTREHRAKGYQERPSFTDELPWLDIVGDNHNQVLLEDGVSVAAVIEVDSIPTEARSLQYLAERRDALQSMLCGTFQEHKDTPWILAFYGQNDQHEFLRLSDKLKEYASQVRGPQGGTEDDELDEYSAFVLDNVFGDHFTDMARAGGLFFDPLTQVNWRGCTRRVYAVIYRRHNAKPKLKRGMTPSDELEDQLKKVYAQLETAQIGYRRLAGEEIRAWLFRWLNPAPQASGRDTEEHLTKLPYIELAEDKPFDYTLADDVCTADVVSDAENGLWRFDGVSHVFLQVERLRKRPKIGQLSAEHSNGDSFLCPMDRLPAGSIFCLTITFTPQSQMLGQIDKVDDSATGTSEAAKAVKESASLARYQIEHGNKIFPCSMGVYLRAASDDELRDQITDVESQLAANQLQVVDHEFNDIALDHYVRHLPMSYDPGVFTIEKRNRLIYSQHAANLIPIFGRARGTGHAGLIAYNRGGEPFMFDPLSLLDRSKNGHLFMFGPTGAGKSAKLVETMMFIMAIYRPRIVVVEAGNSFGLLGKFFADKGVSTRDIVLRPGSDTRLPPFTPALQLVDEEGNPIDRDAARVASEAEDDNDPFAQEQARDPLSEMVIVAKIMITGGRESEAERLSQADIGSLQQAIIAAAGDARRQGLQSVTASMVVSAIRKLASEVPERAVRLTEMADAMDVFTRGFEGELFNRHGEALDDADFIRVEMGQLSGKNSSDKLAVAYIGIVNQIISRAEATQRDGRPTIMLTDESHAITTNPLLANYMVEVSKLLGRRLGLWLWFATQNMADFPDEASKMLAMFEWWVCLFMGKGELEELERFKKLSDEQRQMVLSTKKVPGKFSEGVLLADNLEGLFRNVPPALALALAQTEKEEKTARAKLMTQHNCSELEAAMMIANQIAEQRRAA